MSVNLLNKKGDTTPAGKERRRFDWRFLIALPIWVTLSFFAAQFLIVVLVWLLRVSGYPVQSQLNPTVFEALVAGLVYLFTLMIVIGVPWLVRKRPTTLDTLGLQRLLTWTDLGLAPLTYIVYVLVLAAALAAIIHFFPSFQLDQAQDVGFKTLSHQYEYMLAFATLVVIGPVAEEALFRGYLYGKLRSHVPIYVAMLVTSLLFAIAHGQWNVAVDTFILSMVLCGLREITGSIWAGIVVHMLKNFIAFYSLFVAPYMMLGG
jgi:membrane protease YdiL (CAAX protease family)